jgi:hypothetical protein
MTPSKDRKPGCHSLPQRAAPAKRAVILNTDGRKNSGRFRLSRATQAVFVGCRGTDRKAYGGDTVSRRVPCLSGQYIGAFFFAAAAIALIAATLVPTEASARWRGRGWGWGGAAIGLGLGLGLSAAYPYYRRPYYGYGYGPGYG